MQSRLAHALVFIYNHPPKPFYKKNLTLALKY